MLEGKILVSGAAGEVGHSLIRYLSQEYKDRIVAFDVQHRPPEFDTDIPFVQGDLTDNDFVERLYTEHEFGAVFHLAALLSTAAERDPLLAHEVNVNGTIHLMQCAYGQALKTGRPVKFIFPSSIGVYGIPSREEKRKAGSITEDQYVSPLGMYGLNKLYIEKVYRYFSGEPVGSKSQHVLALDFRSVRFPALLSAETLPAGGTSDYGPEMLHAAAKGEPYSCFVEPEAKIPFMAMPDAVKALVELSHAPLQNLTTRVYNVGAFAVSAKEIEEIVKGYFPDAQINYEITPERAALVATWPEDVDDSAARRDWGWAPTFDCDRAFSDYLVPGVRERYGV